jgi:hypothetical protein
MELMMMVVVVMVDLMLEGRLNGNMRMLMVLMGRVEGDLVYNLDPLVVRVYFARISQSSVNGRY